MCGINGVNSKSQNPNYKQFPLPTGRQELPKFKTENYFLVIWKLEF